jgi:hypothetical protein
MDGCKNRVLTPQTVIEEVKTRMSYVVGALNVVVSSSQSRAIDSLRDAALRAHPPSRNLTAHGLEPQDVLVKVPGLVQIQRGEPDVREPFV